MHARKDQGQNFSGLTKQSSTTATPSGRRKSIMRVPIASDVDCAGGSGNGPEYVAGPITVVGPDVYGLDRDGDGVACE